MDLMFERTNVACYQPLEIQRVHQEEQAELFAPESMPELGQIVDQWAELILRSKEVGARSVRVTGAIQAGILYLAEGERLPRKLDCYQPFSVELEHPEISDFSCVQLQWQVRSADAQLQSGRKALLRVQISSEFRIWNPADVRVPRLTGRGESVQVLERSYPMLLPRTLTERTFQLQQDAELPTALPPIDEILSWTVRTVIQEQKVSAMSLAFRGTLRLYLLYRGEEGRLAVFETELPFTQYVDLPERFEEAGADLTLLVTGRELQLLDERRVQLQLAILAQCRVSVWESIGVVEDLYSTACLLDPEQEQIRLSALLDQRTLSRTLHENLAVPCTGVESVRAAAGQPEISCRDGSVQIQIPVEASFLCRDQNEALFSGSGRCTAEFSLDAARQCSCICAATVLDAYAAPAAGGVELRCTIQVQAEFWAKETLTAVSGAAARPFPETSDRPSVVIRRVEAGESLWRIAKDSGSAVEVLRQANGLNGEPREGALLLIPMQF